MFCISFVKSVKLQLTNFYKLTNISKRNELTNISKRNEFTNFFMFIRSRASLYLIFFIREGSLQGRLNKPNLGNLHDI